MSTSSKQSLLVPGSKPADLPTSLAAQPSMKLPPKLPSSSTSATGSKADLTSAASNNYNNNNNTAAAPLPLPTINKDHQDDQQQQQTHRTRSLTTVSNPSSGQLPPPQLPTSNNTATPPSLNRSKNSTPVKLPPALPSGLPRSTASTPNKDQVAASETTTTTTTTTNAATADGQSNTTATATTTATTANASVTPSPSSTTTATTTSTTKPPTSAIKINTTAAASPSPSRGPQRPRFPARISQSHEELVSRLTYYFEKYSPNLTSQVPLLIQRYGKREADLWDSLFDKYGPEPDVPKAGLDLKTRLIAFFRKYDPKYESKVDKIMKAYEGHEDGMWKALYNQYGPEDCEAPEDMSVFTTKATADGKPMDLTSRLRRFFEKHDATRVGSADQLAFEFAEKETELKSMLKAMYFGGELEEAPESVSRRRNKSAAGSVGSPGGSRSSPGRRGGSPTPSSRLEMRAWLREFFTRHSPERSTHVDELMEQFTGREDQLFEALEASFGLPDGNGQLTQMDRLVRFFAKYEPERTIEQVEAFKEKYRGKEKMCWDMLIAKHGPEPDGPVPRYTLSSASTSSSSVTATAQNTNTTTSNNADAANASAASPSRQLDPSFQQQSSSPISKEQQQQQQTATAASGNTQSNHRGRLVTFFRKYDSPRIASVDQLLQDYRGLEDQMWADLTKRYGPEPESSTVNSMTTMMAANTENSQKSGTPPAATTSPRSISPGAQLLSAQQQQPSSTETGKKRSPSPNNTLSTSSATTTTPETAQQQRARLKRFYLAYGQPDKASDEPTMDKAIKKYDGRYEEMWDMLTKKYGPEPDQNGNLPGTSTTTTTTTTTTGATVNPPATTSPINTNPANSIQNTNSTSETNANNNTNTSASSPVGGVTSSSTAPPQTQQLQPQTSNSPLGSTTAAPTTITSTDRQIISAPTPSPPNTIANTKAEEYRGRLMRFYQQYDASKATDEQVNKVLEKYAGREEEALAQLVQKYGPEPTAVQSSSSAVSQQQSSPQQQQSSSNIVAASPSSTISYPSGEQLLSAASSSPSQELFRKRLMRFYQKYDPTKATDDQVTKVLTKYQGREELAMEMLVDKYGPEPSETENLAASTSSAANLLQSSASFSGASNNNNNNSLYQSPNPNHDQRTRLVAFYKHYDPAKGTDAQVDKVLAKYQGGGEDQMWMGLTNKYGPEPVINNTNNTSTGTTATATAVPLTSSASITAGYPSASSYSPPKPHQEQYRLRLMRFYQQYDPSKATDEQVNRVLEKYSGREEDALAQLVQKYGPEPAAVTSSPASPTSINNNNNSAAASSFQIPNTHHKERLTFFYNHYDSSKIENVEAALQKYAGREELMWSQLTAKYGEEPGHQEKVKLLEYLAKNDPVQIQNIHMIVIPYIGQFDLMWKNLQERYGD